MSGLPVPMTPADCDLRGYEYMPLFGGKLFSSDFEAHASDLAFRVAIRLYWESWLQVPASSLPNDDVKLCRLAGLGRDMKTWRRLRADGVLHGFILCSDDRIYHALIAEQALKAWECSRRKERARDQTAERVRRFRDKQTNGQGENVTRYEGEGNALRNAENDGGNAACNASRGDKERKREEIREKARLCRAAAGAAKTAADGWSLLATQLTQTMLICDAPRARSFLGGLLKAANNDHALVMAKLQECRHLSPIDPATWLMAACGRPFRPKVTKAPYRNGAFTVIENDMTPLDRSLLRSFNAR